MSDIINNLQKTPEKGRHRGDPLAVQPLERRIAVRGQGVLDTLHAISNELPSVGNMIIAQTAPDLAESVEYHATPDAEETNTSPQSPQATVTPMAGTEEPSLPAYDNAAHLRAAQDAVAASQPVPTMGYVPEHPRVFQEAQTPEDPDDKLNKKFEEMNWVKAA